MKKRTRCSACGLFAAALAIASLWSPAVRADNLLGNLPQSVNTATLSIGDYMGAQYQVAVKFTMPAKPFVLENMQFRLRLALSGGQPRISLHDNDNGDMPGTELAVLTNPPLSDDPGTYTFSAPGIVRLEANTSYWFLVDHADNTADFIWARSAPAKLPAGPDPPALSASFDLFRASDDNGASYSPSTQYASFQINAAPVVFQPDLSIGETDQPGRAKKDDKYNSTGAGQKLAATLEGRKKAKAYLFVQSDSNDIDTLTLKSNVPRKKLYRLKIFQLTGGKANITGAVKGAGFAFPDLAPGERILCRIELKGKGKHGNHTVKYTGRSAKDAGKKDVNLLKLKARP